MSDGESFSSFNDGKRQPAKFSYTKTPTSLELHVTDPKLPQGLHITGKKTSSGDFMNRNSPWSAKFDVTVKYAADPKKQITIMKESKREIVGQRQKMSGRTELVQEANNLNHKMYITEFTCVTDQYKINDFVF